MFTAHGKPAHEEVNGVAPPLFDLARTSSPHISSRCTVSTHARIHLRNPALPHSHPYALPHSHPYGHRPARTPGCTPRAGFLSVPQGLTPVASTLGLGPTIAVRAVLGFCSGVIYPVLSAMFGRWITSIDRSKAYAVADFGGILGAAGSGLLVRCSVQRVQCAVCIQTSSKQCLRKE